MRGVTCTDLHFDEYSFSVFVTSEHALLHLAHCGSVGNYCLILIVRLYQLFMRPKINNSEILLPFLCLTDPT